MYQFAHLNTASDIIGLYDGKEPFHHFIKAYFKASKKAGSRDRKQIAHLCYSYFRVGRSLAANTFEERMIAALFLCEQGPNPYLEVWEKEWNAQLSKGLSIKDKIHWIKQIVPSFDQQEIFPFNAALSEGIDRNEFILSHLIQPNLFLRIRPVAISQVFQKLEEIPGFLYRERQCIALKNGTKLEDIVAINRDVIIQDKSSQAVESFLPSFNSESSITVWDACAASGGKSIIAADHYNHINLTVTDKRSSIIHNLHERLSLAGIRDYYSMVTDLSKQDAQKPSTLFDLVIADVPCSGSGTWGRTPEQLAYFDELRIDEYQQLQRSILINLFSSVKPGGYLLYITCSVFKKENEENVEFLNDAGKLQVIRSGVIKGYDQQADTMFAALLKRSVEPTLSRPTD